MYQVGICQVTYVNRMLRFTGIDKKNLKIMGEGMFCRGGDYHIKQRELELGLVINMGPSYSFKNLTINDNSYHV